MKKKVPLAPGGHDGVSTALGWIALVGAGEGVRRLVFGYETPDEAVAALGEEELALVTTSKWKPKLVARLKAFARGGTEDFRDVDLQLPPRTPFQGAHLVHCRRVAYGQTATYASLARAAGYPRAARAVGNVMATNRVPLIVPCHRVLATGGLGGYGSHHGLAMKKRLLDLESVAQARGETDAGCCRPSVAQRALKLQNRYPLVYVELLSQRAKALAENSACRQNIAHGDAAAIRRE